MSKRKKIIVIVIIFIFSIVLILGILLALLVSSYLSKITYEKTGVSDEVAMPSLSDEEIMQELLAEELTCEEDSSEEEIALLESQMSQQLAVLQQQNGGEEQEELDIFNVLLIGCDSRKQGGVGRSDAMVLISVNKDTEKIHMTSIMRDCYVTIPGKGNNRINASYAFGGGSLLLDTVETNFSVDVDHYFAFDFYSFVEIVDSIGGIEIDVSEAEIPVLNGYVKELNKLNDRAEGTYYVTESGSQLLNGTQALGYSRIRYVGDGDFERTSRQRTVITKIFEKVKGMNLLELNDLMNVFLPKLRTNMTQEEVLSHMLRAGDYLQYDLDSMRIPIDGSYQNMRVNGMAVLGIDLEENQDALREFIKE